MSHTTPTSPVTPEADPVAGPTCGPDRGRARGGRGVLVAVVAFAVAIAVFSVTRGGSPGGDGARTIGGGVRPDGSTTDATIRMLQAEVRAGQPREAALADAYLQKARETGDLGYSLRAEALLHEALKRNPHDAGAVVDLGTLAASRHDFRTSLRLARQARALAPGMLTAYPLLVDALVELGRFSAA